MTSLNSKLDAFFEDFLAYHSKFYPDKNSKFQKIFQLYLIHRISSFHTNELIETYTINIGKHIGIERYKEVRRGEKEHSYYLTIGNKQVFWKDCPEKTLITIEEKINKFRTFLKYSGCNTLEKLNVEHVMQNVNLYCDMACESTENKMFDLLFYLEDKKINKKLLSLVEIIPDKMKEERVKKLNSFSLMSKLENKLSEEIIKPPKMKI